MLAIFRVAIFRNWVYHLTANPKGEFMNLALVKTYKSAVNGQYAQVLWSGAGNANALLMGGQDNTGNGGYGQYVTLGGGPLGGGVLFGVADNFEVPARIDKAGNVYVIGTTSQIWKLNSNGAQIGECTLPLGTVQEWIMNITLFYVGNVPYLLVSGRTAANNYMNSFALINANTMVAVWTKTVTLTGADTYQINFAVSGVDNAGNAYFTIKNTTTSKYELWQITFAGVAGTTPLYTWAAATAPRSIIGTQTGNLIILFGDATSTGLVWLLDSPGFSAIAKSITGGYFYSQNNSTYLIDPQDGNFGLTDSNDEFQLSSMSDTGSGGNSVTLTSYSAVDLSTKSSLAAALPYNAVGNYFVFRYIPSGKAAVVGSWVNTDAMTGELDVYGPSISQALSPLLRIPLPSMDDDCLPEGRCAISFNVDFTDQNSCVFDSRALNQLGKFSAARSLYGMWNGKTGTNLLIEVAGTQQRVQITGESQPTPFLVPIITQMPCQLVFSTSDGSLGTSANLVITNYEVKTTNLTY